MNKKFFPGGNTGCGFVNLFDGITPSWEPVPYTYILKGGPGVGKSTLMKKITDAAHKLGLEAEEFHCAADPQSFDAVRLPEKKIVVLDGTAPHTIDPEIPGAGQEIVNLGHFKNSEMFTEKYPELKRLFDENKAHYRIAYSYLRAAADLKKCAVDAAAETVNIHLVRYCIADFLGAEEIDGGYSPRRLFSSAITPDGIVDFSDSCADNGISINIGGVFGYVFLREAMDILKNSRAQFFMDSILPDIPGMIVMPDGGTVFAVSKESEGNIDRRDLMTGVMPGFIDYNMSRVREFIEKAIGQLKACKEIHDRIEEVYRPFVNYDIVDMESEALLAKLNIGQ